MQPAGLLAAVSLLSALLLPLPVPYNTLLLLLLVLLLCIVPIIMEDSAAADELRL